jgi:hypothetical protein
MSYRRHRRSTRHRTERRRAQLLIALTLLIAGGLAIIPFGWNLISHEPTKIVWLDHYPASNLQPPSVAQRGGSSNKADSRSGKLVYPYSVVPGGVQDPESLRAAVERDPIVAAHYLDFHLENARRTKLASSRSAYVSYRIGNRIYWTHKKLRLAKGEEVITDGVNIARARCANRISAKLEGETSPAEPPAAVLDTPSPQPARAEGTTSSSTGPLTDPGALGAVHVPDLQDLTDTPLNEGLNSGPPPHSPPSNPGAPGLPVLPPFLGAPPDNSPPNNPGYPGAPGNPMTPVPEPDTVLLFVGGLSALAALRPKLTK